MPYTQPQSQSLAGDPRDGTVVGGQRSGRKLDCKTGSTYMYIFGHVVNGRIARPLEYLLQIMHALDILN